MSGRRPAGYYFRIGKRIDTQVLLLKISTKVENC